MISISHISLFKQLCPGIFVRKKKHGMITKRVDCTGMRWCQIQHFLVLLGWWAKWSLSSSDDGKAYKDWLKFIRGNLMFISFPIISMSLQGTREYVE